MRKILTFSQSIYSEISVIRKRSTILVDINQNKMGTGNVGIKQPSALIKTHVDLSPVCTYQVKYKYVCGCSHLVGGFEGVLCFLLRFKFSVFVSIRRGLLVSRGNGSVVLCGAGGDVPEIDLWWVWDLPPAWGQVPIAPYVCWWAIHKHILPVSVSHKCILCTCMLAGSHMIVTHTHTHTGDKQSKFQRWSARPYLVAVVIATPGLIPCSRTRRAAACLSSSLSRISSLLSAFFICLSIPSHLLLLCHTSQAIITCLIQLCSPSFFPPCSHPAICSILSLCPS